MSFPVSSNLMSYCYGNVENVGMTMGGGGCDNRNNIHQITNLMNTFLWGNHFAPTIGQSKPCRSSILQYHLFLPIFTFSCVTLLSFTIVNWPYTFFIEYFKEMFSYIFLTNRQLLTCWKVRVKISFLITMAILILRHLFIVLVFPDILYLTNNAISNFNIIMHQSM